MYLNLEHARVEVNMGMEGLLFINGRIITDAFKADGSAGGRSAPHKVRALPFIDCNLFHVHSFNTESVVIFRCLSPLSIALHCPLCGWRQLVPSQQIKTVGDLARFLEPDDH